MGLVLITVHLVLIMLLLLLILLLLLLMLLLLLLLLLLIMLLLVRCQGPIALSQPVLVALRVLLCDELEFGAVVRCISDGQCMS